MAQQWMQQSEWGISDTQRDAPGPWPDRFVLVAGWFCMAVVVKTNGIPFWLVREFTTHFRTYLSGLIESDVHWGYDLEFDPGPYHPLFLPFSISLPKSLDSVGVLFGCVAGKIAWRSWFTWWFNHLPGKPIYFP